VVRLDAPLGEGYLWQITKSNKGQLKPLDKAPPDKLGKGRPSTVEQQVYYLRAEAAGASDLELEYRLAKDKDAKPAKTFKVKVKIDK
jgi:predicted secreted protein